MKHFYILVALIAGITLAAFPTRSLAQITINIVSVAPPELPDYSQPLVPGPNYIWMPGFWQWGPAGYYWVPGTWTLAPEPGLLWTPGYWAWNGNGYAWNEGYWANNVGYYGDVDYGSGYYGNGYEGGRWFGPVFRYNTYVSRVDPRVVEVYRTVIVNRTVNRICYVGGRGGLQNQPTFAQREVAHIRHYGLTSTQREHIEVASHNRNYLANVNHGRPQNAAFAEPLSKFHQPSSFSAVTTRDRDAGHPQHAAAPVEHHAAQPQPQHAAAPVEHHAAQPQPQHANAPAEHHDTAPQHVNQPAQHRTQTVQHAAPPAQHQADTSHQQQHSDSKPDDHQKQ